MHTATLTTAANNNQVIKISKAVVEFTPELIATLAKLKASERSAVAVGEFTIMALGYNKYGMWYTKNNRRIATFAIKNARITILK